MNPRGDKRGCGIRKAGAGRDESYTQLAVTEPRVAVSSGNRVLLMPEVDDLDPVPLGEIDDQILIGVAHQRKGDSHPFALYCIGNSLEYLHPSSVPRPASLYDQLSPSGSLPT